MYLSCYSPEGKESMRGQRGGGGGHPPCSTAQSKCPALGRQPTGLGGVPGATYGLATGARGGAGGDLRIGYGRELYEKCICPLPKMFFNGFHVAQLARSPRAARARRGPLRRRVAVGRDHTLESFNFTNFYKGSAISITF